MYGGSEIQRLKEDTRTQVEIIQRENQVDLDEQRQKQESTVGRLEQELHNKDSELLKLKNATRELKVLSQALAKQVEEAEIRAPTRTFACVANDS